MVIVARKLHQGVVGSDDDGMPSCESKESCQSNFIITNYSACKNSYLKQRTACFNVWYCKLVLTNGWWSIRYLSFVPRPSPNYYSEKLV